MFLLQLPGVIRRAVATGHMAEEAGKMLDLLTDPERTIVNLVTLAEEMPVNETLEMRASLAAELEVRVGYVIANAVLPERFEPDDVRLLEEAARAACRPTRGAGRGPQAQRRWTTRALHPLPDCRRGRLPRAAPRDAGPLHRGAPTGGHRAGALPPAPLTPRLGRAEHLQLGAALLDAAARHDAGAQA